MVPTPTEVHLKSTEKRLDITWSDGRTLSYALAYLRGWCPCAHCQGHFAQKMTFIDRGPVELKDVQPVGAYGMRLVWADGHQGGIYSYEYLAELGRAAPGEGPSNDELLNG